MENICFHVVCLGKSILFVQEVSNFQVYGERSGQRGSFVCLNEVLCGNHSSFLMASRSELLSSLPGVGLL